MSETHYYAYDYPNQLEKIVKVEKPAGEGAVYTGCAYFEHDDSGNMTAWARYDENDDLIEASYYDWDEDNQLLSLTRSVAGTDTYFTYDGDFQRVARKTGAATTRAYHWDGLKVMLERVGMSTERTHTHGPAPVAGIGTELGYREQSGGAAEDLWTHRDALGSTWLESDEGTPPDEVGVPVVGAPASDAGDAVLRTRPPRARDIKVRRANLGGMVVAAHIGIALVIGDDGHDVGPSRPGGRRLSPRAPGGPWVRPQPSSGSPYA